MKKKETWKEEEEGEEKVKVKDTWIGAAHENRKKASSLVEKRNKE